jgi:hypothetical protein
MTTGFEIGIADDSTMTDLDDLTIPIPAPQSPFKPFYDYRILADGSKRGLGAATAIWRWAYLTDEQRDELRAFCGDPSAVIFITTRTAENSDSFATYAAIMNWPEEAEDRQGQRLGTIVRHDFVLEFRSLVAQ